MHEKEIHADSAEPVGPEGPAASDRSVSIIHRPPGRLETDADGCSEPLGSDQETGGRSFGKKLGGAYVYVFASSIGTPKIGMSGSPDMRLVDVKKTFPHLECVSFSRAFSRNDAYKVEKDAHRRLQHVSCGNELFACTTEEAIDAVMSSIAELGVEEVETVEGGWNGRMTGVRIDPSLKDRLRELAAERRWTLSVYIEWALEQHFESIDAASKPPRSQKRP